MNEKIESLEDDLKNSRQIEEQLKQDAETAGVEILELKESLMASENKVSWLHVVWLMFCDILVHASWNLIYACLILLGFSVFMQLHKNEANGL